VSSQCVVITHFFLAVAGGMIMKQSHVDNVK